MKKTYISNDIALILCTAGTANAALTVDITQMNFNGLYNTTGSITDAGTGIFNSLTAFFGQHWTATATAFFSAGSGANTWAGTHPAGFYSYNFSLTPNQVAWGTLFDWNTSSLIPILNIMTCSGFSNGDTCIGIGTPMQTPPFAGQAPSFNGVVAASLIPIPAASWLFVSGLLGLIGVSRKIKTE